MCRFSWFSSKAVFQVRYSIVLFVVSLLRMGCERVINSTAEYNQIQPRDIKYRCCILIGTEASCVYPFPVTSVGGNRRGYLTQLVLGWCLSQFQDSPSKSLELWVHTELSSKICAGILHKYNWLGNTSYTSSSFLLGDFNPKCLRMIIAWSSDFTGLWDQTQILMQNLMMWTLHA